jgi:nucleotide-binding universal stress UspA family protein
MRAHESARRAAPGVESEAEAIFNRILVGIDETPESLVAAAQAGVLRAADGHIELVAVAERHRAAQAGFSAPHAQDVLIVGTETDLARAKELVDADTAVLAFGHLVDVLRSRCADGDATLIALGARPHSRVTALTFGSNDAEVLHDATCSILIARPGWGPSRPDRVVIALDGSPESRTAEVVGRSLARRLGREAVPVIGLGDDIELAVLREERDDALLDPGRLVDAVASASSRASLVVAGRDRKHGRRRRGSRAEHIVYSAACSVLVVDHVDDARG